MLKKSVILGIKSFLIQLKKTNLDTGIKRKPRANKASAIKEDRQAFGIVLSENIDLEEALQYPLKTFPLSLATPERKLRQRNNKALLRNVLITEANAIVENADLIRSRWIVHEMALILPLKTCQTLTHFSAKVFIAYSNRNSE